MPAVTIRNLSKATRRALKARAAQHGRSIEAEMRHILENAVRPKTRLRLGSAIAEKSRRFGVTNQDIEALDRIRVDLQAEGCILAALRRSPPVGADLHLTQTTPRQKSDAFLLESLTETAAPQTQTAADVVRSMRDGERS